MTDTQYIIDQLMKGRKVSRLSIFTETGNMKAPARISEIRSMGYVIDDEFVSRTTYSGRKSKFKKYWMTPENIAPMQ